MKKAGLILCIIGGVTSLLSALIFLAITVLFFMLALNNTQQATLEFLQGIFDKYNLEYMDLIRENLRFMLLYAIYLSLVTVTALAAAAYSLSCHKTHRYLATIIFSCVAMFRVTVILGAIFGWIADKRSGDM